MNKFAVLFAVIAVASANVHPRFVDTKTVLAEVSLFFKK